MPRTCHHGKTKAIAVAVVVTASRAKAQYPWRSRWRFAELGIRTPLAALNRRLLAAIVINVGGYFAGGQQWSDVVVFSILILVLVFRPTGLLGMRVPEK